MGLRLRDGAGLAYTTDLRSSSNNSSLPYFDGQTSELFLGVA